MLEPGVVAGSVLIERRTTSVRGPMVKRGPGGFAGGILRRCAPGWGTGRGVVWCGLLVGVAKVLDDGFQGADDLVLLHLGLREAQFEVELLGWRSVGEDVILRPA